MLSTFVKGRRYLLVLRALAGPAGSKDTETLPGVPLDRLAVIVATVDLAIVLDILRMPATGDRDLPGAQPADLDRHRGLADLLGQHLPAGTMASG